MKKKIFSTLLLVAFTMASTSMFVSCKDYDDDINARATKAEVDRALAELKSALEAEIQNCKTTCAEAHATFATWAALSERDAQIKDLQSAVDALEKESATHAKQAWVEEELKLVNDLIAGKASQADLDALATRVSTLEDKFAHILDGIATVDQVEAVKKDLQEQIGIIEQLRADLTTVTTALEGKADKSALEALELIVNGKADKADLDNLRKDLETSLAGYYSKEEIDNIISGIENKIKDVVLKADFDAALDALAEKYATIADVNEWITDIRSELDNEYYDKTYIDALETTLKNLISANAGDSEAITALETRLKELINAKADTTKLSLLEKSLLALQDKVNKMPAGDLTATEVTQLKSLANIADWLTNLKTDLPNEINVLVVKRLTSLVFRPKYFAGGIESVEAPALAFQPIIYRRAESAKEYYVYSNEGEYDNPSPVATYPGSYEATRQNPWALISNFLAVKHVSYSVPSVAYYHFNPTTTALEDYKLSFYGITSLVGDEVESRQAEIGHAPNFVKPVETDAIKNADPEEAGILKVPFVIDDNYTYECTGMRNGENYGYGEKHANVDGTYTYKGWDAYFHQLVDNADGYIGKELAKTTGYEWFDKITKSNAKVAYVKDYLNFISLRAEKNETINKEDATAYVNSDYAMVVPTIYHINGLADNYPIQANKSPMPKCVNDNWDAKQGKHMYKNAPDAVKNPETHAVKYDSKIDIMRYVETHSTYIGFESEYDSYDKVLDPVTYNKALKYGETGYFDVHRDSAKFAQLGLKYRITPIPWISGDNVTNETAHIAMKVYKNGEPVQDFEYTPDWFKAHGYTVDESATKPQLILLDEKKSWVGIPDSVILTPRSVTDKGWAIVDGGNTRERIDRLPLLKVEVVDKDGNVFEAGYIKIKITEEEPNPEDPTDPVIEIPFAGTYFYDCEFADKVTWAQIENILLADSRLNIKKDEWAANWKLEMKSGVAKLYELVGAEFKEQDPQIGKVSEIVDVLSHETTVLQWAVDRKDYSKIAHGKFEDGTIRNTEELVTYVKYEAITPFAKGKGNVYIKLSFPVGSIIFPQGEIGNKRAGYWYKINTNTSATGNLDAIDTHMNVRTPMTKTQTTNILSADEFQKDLYEYFINQEGILTGFADGFQNNDLVKPFVDFEFTTPAKAKKNAEFDAADDDTWEVKGFSGATYTLQLNETLDIIYVIAEDGKALATPVILAQIYRQTDADGVQETMLRYGNYGTAAATEGETVECKKTAETDDRVWDILNRDNHFQLANGATVDDRETFTAYIHVITDACIPVELKNAYFNVKFLRPLNWYPNTLRSDKDAPNGRQEFTVGDFVNFSDWRCSNATNYAATTYKVTKNGSGSNAEATWKYYGILFFDDADVLLNECYTDVAEFDRPDLKNDQVAINNAIKTGKVRKANSLKGFDLQLRTSNFDGTTGITPSDPSTWKYSYKNNEGTVDKFHIYVPICIRYTYSPQVTKLIKVWGTIEIDRTVQNAKRN